jgi:transposase
MSDVDTKEKRRNKRWPEALKREIVEATLQPGASVSVVARLYDVNANQVFAWRRRYLSEERPCALPSRPATPALVPVTIAPEPEDEQAVPAAPTAPDTIEIEVPDGSRVRVGTGFCRATIKVRHSVNQGENEPGQG